MLASSMSQRPTTPTLFFGASTGRTATMAFANALNSEDGTSCLHEGKFRHAETSGDQVIPFLTLENRLAFEDPTIADEVIATKRSDLLDLARDRNDQFFGDVAYNNAPFITALAKKYPAAKFIFFFRQCLDFVRSAASEEGTDETPVGWPPADKPLTNVERYIALGRLQPREDSKAANQWESWSHRAKNIWLWAATNQLLLSQIETLPAASKHIIYFDEFKSDPVRTYEALRTFLGFSSQISDTTRNILLERPINKRQKKPAPITFDDLADSERKVFEEFAKPVNRRLFT